MNIDANLKTAYKADQELFEKEISRVLSNASYIMKFQKLRNLRAKLSEFTGAKYSISVRLGPMLYYFQ